MELGVVVVGTEGSMGGRWVLSPTPEGGEDTEEEKKKKTQQTSGVYWPQVVLITETITAVPHNKGVSRGDVSLQPPVRGTLRNGLSPGAAGLHLLLLLLLLRFTGES